MNDAMIIFLLSLSVAVLICVVVYQQFTFRIGIQKNLRGISEKLKEIINSDSNERIMLFTGNKVLSELMEQTNRLIEFHLREKANYRRSEIAYKKMLSNISHDIKTPMTVILGYLEIMRLSGTGTDEMMEKVEQKAAGVMELINQFFTLAKLESGDMNMELSKVDICEICRESALEFYEMLTRSGFQVEISLPEKPVYVQGNKDAIQRILFNLITNVIRYGADGKYFGVFLRDNENTVYVDVVDKGKGIDKQFADSIFERLYTMEDSRNRNIQGNGLGLTIAKGLAAQLGGTITLDSSPYARTAFTVGLNKSPSENSRERNS